MNKAKLRAAALAALLPIFLPASAQTPAPAPTNAPSASAAAAFAAGPQAGQKVAFMGDSITAQGESTPGGYVNLVADALEKQGRKIEVIPAGVGGNTSRDMLKRLDASVLSKKPDWMTLSCGVNDVWHGPAGVPLDEYKQNITSIVDQATAAGIKVVLLEATMIYEDPNNDFNKKLVDYNQFLHQLAAEKHLPIATLNSDEQAELAKEKAETPGIKGNVLTVDGVHMNALGNQVMAGGVLDVFGFTAAQVAQAKEAWMTLPNAALLSLRPGCTAADYLKLRVIATAQGQSVDDMLTSDLNHDIQNHLNAAPPAGGTTKP